MWDSTVEAVRQVLIVAILVTGLVQCKKLSDGSGLELIKIERTQGCENESK